MCGKLSRPGCKQSSLCRLRHDAAAADVDIRKYAFNKMVPESRHLKLVYSLVPSSSTCGNNCFYVTDHFMYIKPKMSMCMSVSLFLMHGHSFE